MRQIVYKCTLLSFMIFYAIVFCHLTTPAEHKNDLSVNMIQVCPCPECEPCWANLWRGRQHPFTDQEKDVARAFLNLPIGIASHKGLPLVDIVLGYCPISPTHISLPTLHSSGVVSYRNNETSGYLEDVGIFGPCIDQHNRIALQDTKFTRENVQRLSKIMSNNAHSSFRFMSLCKNFSYVCETRASPSERWPTCIIKRAFLLNTAARIEMCIGELQKNERNKKKKAWWQFYGVLC